jgi:hypothetical protein
MTTKQTQICDALVKLGHKEIKAKTTKYRVFNRPNSDSFYFVGKSGALRTGKKLGDTFSLGPKNVALILRQAETK